MRWLACVVLLTGCLRARATVVHPTELERSSHSNSDTSIARTPSETPEAPETATPSSNLGSIELGVMFPFRNNRNSARVHIAPGIRIFNSDAEAVFAGVAIGADFRNRFAVEGSLYIGDAHGDLEAIDQVVDLFAGVTMDARSTSIAVGPSVGLLMMPGGRSVAMFGLGLRFTGARE